MLGTDFNKRTLERRRTYQPFVDNDRQRILVAGWTRFAIDLFRGHIDSCAGNRVGIGCLCTLGHRRNAEIAQ